MQYDRMRRSYDLVMTPHQSSVDYQHHLFHYIQDCWHLKDWLKNDPVSGLGEDIEGLVGRRRCKSSLALRMLRSIYKETVVIGLARMLSLKT